MTNGEGVVASDSCPSCQTHVPAGQGIIKCAECGAGCCVQCGSMLHDIV